MSATTAGTCADCGVSLVPLSETAFFLKRPCTQCGRDTYLFDKDPKTSGLRVVKGDRVSVNLNLLLKGLKLVGGVQFSRAGLDVFVRSLLLPAHDLIRNAETGLPPVLDAWIAKAEEVLKLSPRLQDFDIETEEGAKAATELLLKKADTSAEFYALLLHVAASMTRENVAGASPWPAAGAAAMAATAHSMLVYKLEIEEAAWRGHSVETLRATLQLWESNRLNDDEEFWQQTLTSRSIVLSQVFSTPVLLIAGKAYVGGKSVANAGGHISDFLLTNAFTARTCIVELKVPTTPLLTPRPYRNGIYAPSSELAGAVAQVSGYAASLAEEATLRQHTPQPMEPARSECVVVIGTAERELTDADRRRSFELYRAELRNVRVVTYDELFLRVAELLALFGG